MIWRDALRVYLVFSFVAFLAVGFVVAEDDEKDGLTVTGALGISASQGNSETLKLNASASSVWIGKPNELRSGISLAYGEANPETSDPESDSVTDTQKADAYLNARHLIGSKFAYLNTTLRHDDVADIDYRLNIGPGAGIVLYDNSHLTLSIEGGVGYMWEQVAGIPDHYLNLRVAANAAIPLSETSSHWLSAEYVSNPDDSDVYQLAAEAGLQASLTELMGLRLVLSDYYDNAPAEGKKHNDISFVTAITWTL